MIALLRLIAVYSVVGVFFDVGFVRLESLGPKNHQAGIKA